MYSCVHEYTQLYACIDTQTFVHIHIFIVISLYVYICTFVYVPNNLRAKLRVRICIYVCIYTYILEYINIYVYTCNVMHVYTYLALWKPQYLCIITYAFAEIHVCTGISIYMCIHTSMNEPNNMRATLVMTFKLYGMLTFIYVPIKLRNEWIYLCSYRIICVPQL